MSDRVPCKRPPRRASLRRLIGAVAGMLSIMPVPMLARAQTPEPGLPPQFEEVCFGDFDDAREYPTPAAIESLLAPAGQRKHEIVETSKALSVGRRKITRIRGLFRLKTRWQPDTTLRLSLIDPGLFQLHFWPDKSASRGHGVTLRYCPPADHTWGAYGTTRTDGNPRPSTWAVWGLDGGRYVRSGRGTVEIRYDQGNLVLTQGNLRLLSVPLDGLPAEVYMEGRALVRGIAVYRSTGSPKPPEASPAVLRVAKPAEQTWQTKLSEQVVFEKLDDGSAELAAGLGAKSAQAGLDLPAAGLYEYIFELQDPGVGTGIYLGGKDGTPLARLAFYRDSASGRTTFAFLDLESEETELTFDFTRAMVPYAGEHQWVRLTSGGGVMKCFTSGDGVHWSQAIWSPLALRGPVTQVGLYCTGAAEKRSIKLRSFELCRLDTLTSLAPEAIRQRVGPLADAEVLADWDRRVAESRPTDVAADVWQRACILATLVENPYFSLGGELVHRLLDDVLSNAGPASEWDLPRQLKLLDEAALLIHSLDYRSARPTWGHYDGIARRLFRQGHPDPLGAIAPAILQTPIWNDQRQNAWPDKLLRHALLTHACEDRWEQVRELLDSVEFWTRADRLQERELPWDPETLHMIEWGRFQVQGSGARGQGSGVRSQGSGVRGHPAAIIQSPRHLVTPSPLWREPLIERLSKEGYNVLGEFQAALDARDYRAACQIIANSTHPEALGLLPDDRDPRLLASLPVAIEGAMQRVPALRETMQKHFGSLGRLRLERAIAAEDAAAAEAVTLQFCGTEAAALAHGWLGDRRLSSGRAAPAIANYRLALRTAPDGQREALHARLRLAGALIGRDIGRPVASEVEIAGTRVSAEEFEQMVRQLLRQPRGGLAPSTHTVDDSSGIWQCPASGRYEVRPWARVEGSDIATPPGLPERCLDWAGRQWAATIADRQMIVNNQGDLAAFDLETGKQQWTFRQRLRDEETPPWPAVSMRPVAAGKHVFVRRLTRDRLIELACIYRLDGTMIWSSKPSDYVASDPLSIGQDLFALTVKRDLGGKLTVLLAQLDPRSGRVRRESALAEFHDAWEGKLTCRATAADAGVVATVGGCVICCDLAGRVRWVRRQIRIPPPLEPSAEATAWLLGRHESPLVVGRRVLATQPGVWNVECLNLQTGQLIWRKAVPELTGMAGGGPERLIVETADGLVGLDVSDGKALWHHDAADRMEARWCDPANAVVYVQRVPGDESSGEPYLRLVSLDPADGTLQGKAILDVPSHKDVLLGPLVSDGVRHWTFFGAAERPLRREILELVEGRIGRAAAFRR